MTVASRKAISTLLVSSIRLETRGVQVSPKPCILLRRMQMTADRNIEDGIEPQVQYSHLRYFRIRAGGYQMNHVGDRVKTIRIASAHHRKDVRIASRIPL